MRRGRKLFIGVCPWWSWDSTQRDPSSFTANGGGVDTGPRKIGGEMLESLGSGRPASWIARCERTEMEALLHVWMKRDEEE